MANNNYKPKLVSEDDEFIKQKLSEVATPAEEVLASIENKIEEIEKPALNMQAVRRRKVRELRDMGYTKYEIAKILSKGIIIDGKKEDLGEIHVTTIDNDLNYILSEDLATDREFPEKKAELISKYNYIYKKVLGLALESTSMNRAALFNVAKSILDKQATLEGLENPERHDIRLTKAKRPAAVASELNETLSKDEKDAINATIDKILSNRNEEGDIGVPVFDEPSRVPARTSDDEGVSGQS
jgi:hypothetical protein